MLNLIPRMSNEIGPCRRWFLFLIGLIETIFFGGIIFGWGQLVFVLKKEGIYSDLCMDEDTEVTVDYKGCPAQDSKFAFVYSIACLSCAAPGVLFGYILHHYGIAASRFCNSIQLISGLICLGMTSKDTPTYLTVGMVLTGTGGIQLIITNILMADLFPRYRATAFAVLSGSYTASTCVFLSVQFAHEKGISIKTSFWCLAGLSSLMLPVTLVIPFKKIPAEDDDSEMNPLIKRPPIPLSSSIKGFTFFLFTYWYLLTLLAITLFGTYFNSWVSRIARSEKEVEHYSTLYSLGQIACPFVPLFFGLLTDLIQHHLGAESIIMRKVRDVQSTVPATLLVTLIVTVMYTCLLFHERWAYYTGVTMLVIARPSIVSCAKPFIRIRYPRDHFNRLHGLMRTMTVFTTLLQYPHFMWSLHYYSMAQGTGIFFITLSVIFPLHLLYTEYIKKTIEKQSTPTIGEAQEIDE